MKSFFKKNVALFLIGLFTLIPVFTFAQNVIDFNAQNLLPKAEIFINPRNSTFLVGSTFEAPIYIDTRGNSINTINLKINFDPKKLSIINPSGGKSIFGIWVQPPQYDNKRGTASLAGVIPQGAVVSSGLIITMTFKVLSAGETRVSISDESSVNLNDGLGSEILLVKSAANYSLRNKAPDGVNIYSSTHPAQDIWYNNNSPVFSWDTDGVASGYSVVFDTNPGTIPSNVINNETGSVAYENTKDGIWYLHVKSIAKGIWGATSHFQARIDTAIPADFKITANSFKDDTGVKKYMASFFTTDSSSGISHYEIGVLNKNDLNNASPIFVETTSPYVVPMDAESSLRVFVRAYDNAGNVRESYLDLYPGYSFIQMIKKFGVYLLLLIIVLLLIELVLHYVFGHKILEHFKYVYGNYKKLSQKNFENEKISNSVVSPDLVNIPKPPLVSNSEKYNDNENQNSIVE
jgi:hypothetical protein